MRMLSLSVAILMSNAASLLAQEAEQGGGSLMSIRLNLMVWTLVIFLILFVVLSKYAFKPITAAVEAREKALEEAIANAKADREAAAKLLEEHRAQLEAGRSEAQAARRCLASRCPVRIRIWDRKRRAPGRWALTGSRCPR